MTDGSAMLWYRINEFIECSSSDEIYFVFIININCFS